MWSDKRADPWVVEVLHWGYKIPFRAAPKLSEEPIPYPSYSPSSFRGKALASEVLSLVKKGAVELAPLPLSGFYSRLFVVMKASGSWRLVIDLSILNLKVLKTSFKMETLQSVLSVQRGDWMVSLDLKDAYLQVPVHPDSRKYLRFIAFGQIQGSVLWSLHSSSGFYQGHGSSLGFPSSCRYPHSSLPGRLADPSGISFSGHVGLGCGSSSLSVVRNRRQLGQVSSGACAADDISW